MIHSATISYFKGIAFEELGFDPLTVIVGANGTGKTSVLEALFLAIEACANQGPDSFLGEWSLENIASRIGPEDTKVDCRTDDGTFGFESFFFEKILTIPGQPKVRDFEKQDRWDWKALPEDGSESMRLAGQCWPARFLKFQPDSLAADSYLGAIPPAMDQSGYGLPTVLGDLRKSDDRRFKLILDDMRKLVPNIENIRVVGTTLTRDEIEILEVEGRSISHPIERSYPADSLVIDFIGAKGVPASGISSGTLILLGLLTLLHGEDSVKTVLIDDFGDGLHPQAQRELMRLLKAFTERNDIQIIATTHSPFMLDNLSGDQVLLSTVDSKGHCVFGTMSDHPEFEKWKEEMTPGEYWTMIGEKWVAGGDGEELSSGPVGISVEP